MNTCYNPFSLEGKTILVTGASSGIGRAIAIECSKMGGKMVITARNEERLKETFNSLEGDGHRMIIADLVNEEDMTNLVAECPTLQGLVLCAGIGNTLAFQFATRKKMNPVYEVNFFSQVELLRLLLKKKLIEKKGSVVAISSVGGNTRFTPGNAIYGSAKAALRAWMRTAAVELAPKKIRVNCICPAMVITPLIGNGAISNEQLDADAKTYPAGRYGKPEDIAYGAIYLLSDAADWVTASSLMIDGGISKI